MEEEFELVPVSPIEELKREIEKLKKEKKQVEIPLDKLDEEIEKLTLNIEKMVSINTQLIAKIVELMVKITDLTKDLRTMIDLLEEALKEPPQPPTSNNKELLEAIKELNENIKKLYTRSLLSQAVNKISGGGIV